VLATVPDLIYDVGMHNGQDSAYYLHKGYRVVAVEANGVLADQASQRFSTEVAEGRLTILNCAIGEGEGEAEFWVCDDQTDWSSFDRRIASRRGARHHAVQVPVRTFASILDAYGMPHYCKIDIEGSDAFCLDAMAPDRRPAFLSIELDLGRGYLDRLSALGYDRFKLIDQQRMCTPSPAFYRTRRMLPPLVRSVLERAQRAARCRLQDDGWQFGYGSSGPVPEATPGRWVGHARAGRVLSFLGKRVGTDDWTEWFDLHATTADALGLDEPRERARVR
jgi:FkbM family methyltransferase